MIKLPVRARANRTPFLERRMARSHGPSATWRHLFRLDWRRDGMMRFALLVSRAFCHCNGRGGDGQGRRSGSDRRVRRSAADGPTGGTAEQRRSTDLPGRPAAAQAPAAPITCWQSSADGPRATDTGAGDVVSGPELAPVPRHAAAGTLARPGRGVPDLFRAYRANSAQTAPSAPRRLGGRPWRRPMQSAPLFRLWRSGTRCRRPCGSTADCEGRP